jgi:hypothetical protein
MVQLWYVGNHIRNMPWRGSLHSTVLSRRSNRRPGSGTTGTPHHPARTSEPAAEIKTGFVVVPKHWVVDRTYALTERGRGTVTHYDRKLTVSVAWV